MRLKALDLVLMPAVALRVRPNDYQRKFPGISSPVFFYGGLCVAEEIQGLKSQKGGVSHYSHLIEADGMEQNGRRDNIRVFGSLSSRTRIHMQRWSTSHPRLG